MLEKLRFENLYFNSRKQIVYGHDVEKKYFIKIEIKKNQNKTNDLQKEYQVLKLLNDAESATCPRVYDFGHLTKDFILNKIPEDQKIYINNEQEFSYFLQEYIESIGEYTLSDILFTLIEQKKLGFYQGDIKPDNIRFNNGICYFVDYDQAIPLSKEESALDNLAFLNFCSEYDKKKYGFGNWLRHFTNFNKNNLFDCFVNGSLDLEKTSIFKLQKTTNSSNGIYHTIKEEDIFINGSRTNETREALLKNMSFFKEERVLDVGCNAGLLSNYLFDRGCNVSGVDNDAHIIVAAKIISNILGKKVNYFRLDLDEEEKLLNYDTIMLFSVFHHTKKIFENGIKISNSCSRIILETRLLETGKQPINNVWTMVNSWNFKSYQELIDFCEKVFPKFKFKKSYGLVDKNRCILEFIKDKNYK